MIQLLTFFQAVGFQSMYPDPPQKMRVSLRTVLTEVTYILNPGQYKSVPFRTGNWHPTSTVIVTNTRTSETHEYQLGEAIVF